MNQATRLLIVEDNPLDITLLRMAFDDLGWRLLIIEAHDGEQAITALKDNDPPDFVVLDLNLPRRDGSEVLQFIRTSPKISETPVAVLSSSPGDVIEHRLTEAGVMADCHFTKPACLDEFLQIGKALYRCYARSSAPTMDAEIAP